MSGYFDFPWWGYVLAALALTHITIVSVTIFLHRHQSHRALTLHPVTSHFFRFWLWLTTGMVTKEWVAIHRKHHARCETAEDPHSPQIVGIKKVLLDIAREEKTHVGEFQTLLLIEDKEQVQELEEGKKEAQELLIRKKRYQAP